MLLIPILTLPIERSSGWTWEQEDRNERDTKSKQGSWIPSPMRQVSFLVSFRETLLDFCSNSDPFYRKPSVMSTFSSANRSKMGTEDHHHPFVFAFPLLVTIAVDFVSVSLIDHPCRLIHAELLGPFLNFKPWIPIVADRSTRQTIIYSSSGSRFRFFLKRS
jgi:hypothetical protein